MSGSFEGLVCIFLLFSSAATQPSHQTNFNLTSPDLWTWPPGFVIHGMLSTHTACANLIPQSLWSIATPDKSAPRIFSYDAKDAPYNSGHIMQFMCRDVTNPNLWGPSLPKAVAGVFYLQCPYGWQHQYPVQDRFVYDFELGYVEWMRFNSGICVRPETWGFVIMQWARWKCVKLRYNSFAHLLPEGRNTYRIVAWMSRQSDFSPGVIDYDVYGYWFRVMPILPDHIWPWSTGEPMITGDGNPGIVLDYRYVVPKADYKACVLTTSSQGTRASDIEMRLSIAAEIFFADSYGLYMQRPR